MSEKIILQAPDGLLKVGLNPAHGAEISSLQVRYSEKWGDAWTETLYRADDYSHTDGWQGRGPWLWPAVGRNATPDYQAKIDAGDADARNGRWSTGGAEYPMPIHGFAMRKVWEVVESSSGGATLLLKSDDETRLHYPFDFVVTLRAEVSDRFANFEFSVLASEDNSGAMPWSVGNHITFSLPWSDESSWEECFLSHTCTQQYGLTEQGTMSGDISPLDQNSGLSIADSRWHNGVFGGFREECWSASVVDPNAFGITVGQKLINGPENALTTMRKEHYVLVMWGNSEEGYICPEPWAGLPNSLNSKDGVVSLSPGGSAEWNMTLELTGV